LAIQGPALYVQGGKGERGVARVVVVVTGGRSSRFGDEDRSKNPETEIDGERRNERQKREIYK
jgi:hypothetical protein